MNCKSISSIVLHHKYSRTLVYFSAHQEEPNRTGCVRRRRTGQDAGKDTGQDRMQEKTQDRKDAGEHREQKGCRRKTQQGGRAGVQA